MSQQDQARPASRTGEGHAFEKWSASGNTTLFFEERLAPTVVARALSLDCLGAEQAAFVADAALRMDMAGGEFCVNATRSFGARLLRASGEREAMYRVQVSGWPAPIDLLARRVGPDRYHVAAGLVLPFPRIERSGAERLVHLEGITHLLVPQRATRPLPHADEPFLERARDVMRDRRMDQEPACGIVWYRERPMAGQAGGWLGYEMLPVVYVAGLDTLYAERACGSGALALSLALATEGGRDFSILQPSGEELDVSIEPSPDRVNRVTATVSGEVRLVAAGHWFAED